MRKSVTLWQNARLYCEMKVWKQAAVGILCRSVADDSKLSQVDEQAYNLNCSVLRLAANVVQSLWLKHGRVVVGRTQVSR